MKKIFILTLVAFGLTPFCYSQNISFQISPISPYSSSIDPVVRSILINNSSTNSLNNCIYKVKLTRRGGLTVLRTISGSFTISPGISQFFPSSLPLQEYLPEATTKEFQYLSNYRMLPKGEYVIYGEIFQNNLLVANDALEFIIEPISKPLLISPLDNQAITTITPQFTWIGPYSSSPTDKLTYELKIVELRTEQSAQTAILQNLAIFQQNNLSNTNLLYPLNAYKLEGDKKYAWQVKCYINGNFFAETEIWTFFLNNEKLKSTSNTSFYVTLGKEDVPSSSIEIKNGFVNFKYYEEYKAGKLNLRVLNSKNEDYTPKDRVNKKLGENWISLDLKKTGTFKISEHYTLIVQNEKKEIFKLKFIYGE